MLVRRSRAVNPGQLLLRHTLDRGEVLGSLLLLRLIQGRRQGVIGCVVMPCIKRLTIERYQSLK
jgi:hypothetical protein